MSTRLSSEEKRTLMEVAQGILGSKQATSISVYGSKVAGYAKPDSDYDLIIAVKKFRSRVRYRYVEDGVNASALIVDEKLMLEDASKASLGEFVAGRLLNIYEPLLDREFARKAEVAYKKRVLAEALIEISAEYGDFAQDLMIPLDYILFDKLRKRAMIYPPVLYSYVRTYTCERADENRSFSIDGFREAAASLESEGIFSLDDGAVRIHGDKLKANSFDRLKSLFDITTRGVTQYAVHGYAGRVGLGIFKKEALSKLKRMREKVEPLPELDNPKELLRLEEGALFSDASRIIEELAKRQGTGTYAYTEKNLGQVYSTARVITIDAPQRTKFVVKRYADIWSVKWAVLSIWAFTRKFSMSPLARLHREYYASRKLRRIGIKTPRIIGIAPSEKILVREYLEGTPLSDEIDDILSGRSSDTGHVSEYGRVLGEIHETGLALGDGKANNIIVKEGDLYITDLEQAVEGGEKPWDIAEFLYYSGKFTLKEEGMRNISSAFLGAYSEVSGSENIAQARAAKYLAPFRPFLAPQVLKAIRRQMDGYSS